MKTIWKYRLKVIHETQELKIPGYNPQILSFQFQNNEACIWVLVEQERQEFIHKFVIIGTGWLITENNNLEYVGTTQNEGFVWHLFRVL